MKVNLLLNNAGEARNGYLNVDPFAPDASEDGRVKCPVDKMNGFVEANECTELVAHEVLDAFSMRQVDEVLSHWVGRLAHGGKLAISVVDAKEVSRAYLAGKLSNDDFNALIHGDRYHRQCSLTLLQLVDVVKAFGLNILLKRVENFRAIVVGERP